MSIQLKIHNAQCTIFCHSERSRGISYFVGMLEELECWKWKRKHEALIGCRGDQWSPEERSFTSLRITRKSLAANDHPYFNP